MTGKLLREPDVNGLINPQTLNRSGTWPRLIFGSVAYIPKRFANDRDRLGFVECKFSCRANVQRESSARPTENGLANLTPQRFCQYFSNNDARLVAGRVT
jgi:hypothetical protein